MARAAKGSKKELSVQHENYVAERYEGRRSPSSGGAAHDQGDVRVIDAETLFECKGKFGERTGEKKVRSTLVSQMEKIADEAWSESRDPALALRFYMPESTLSDTDGYVDLTVRLTKDDGYMQDRLRDVDDLPCPEEGRWR